MEVTRAVVFDLDDTLYLERDYVASGFRRVANALCEECDAPTDDVYSFLRCGFEAGIRRCAFDRLLVRYPSVASRWTVENIVEVYRSHHPAIELLPDTLQMFQELTNCQIRMALLTDGPVVAQSNKIEALCLAGWVDVTVLTDRWGLEYRKPHPRGYQTAMSLLRMPAEQLVYVGDNPAKDFRTPRSMGWSTVRLRLPGQLHWLIEPSSDECAADCEVVSIQALTRRLSDMCLLVPRRSTTIF